MGGDNDEVEVLILGLDGVLITNVDKRDSMFFIVEDISLTLPLRSSTSLLILSLLSEDSIVGAKIPVGLPHSEYTGKGEFGFRKRAKYCLQEEKEEREIEG